MICRLLRSAFAATLLVVTAAGISGGRAAEGPPAHDILNATLWMQRSVEYKANCIAVFALARMRLDEALAEQSWTGAPAEQTGGYQNLPPAVIADVDETLVDNSAYQAWMILTDKTFEPKTWTAFVNSQTSTAMPGAVEFVKYADSKGVKVFYVSNRTAEEPATRQNMERLGFPMGGNVDVFLFARKKPDWGSAKGTRRAYVAKEYRVLLNLGDNFGDFVDSYRGTEAERAKVFDDNRDRWGREWIMLANPSYGSFESAPFNHDYKLPIDQQRKMKRDALQPWKGPDAPK